MYADMLLPMLSGALLYFALDLAIGYHQLRINPAETQKNAFKTQFGQFQWPHQHLYSCLP
jgi:hypothetical protein